MEKKDGGEPGKNGGIFPEILLGSDVLFWDLEGGQLQEGASSNDYELLRLRNLSVLRGGA